MANALDTNFGFTYNGILSKDVMFKPTEQTPALDSLFTIIPGIKYKQQMVLSPAMDDIVRAYTGCARSTTDGVDFTSRELEVHDLELNQEWCKDTFETATYNHLAQEYLKSGVDSFDPSGTQVGTWINSLVSDAARRDLFKLASFGDTTSGSASYNGMDGMITKLVADAGSGSSYCVKRASTALGTGTLAAGTALSTIKEMFEEAPNIIKQAASAQFKFLVSGSFFDNLVSSYESLTAGSEIQVQWVVGGIPKVTWRGYEVIALRYWDTLLADTSNPLNGTVEHFAVLTTKENHFFGVDAVKDLSTISGWYERKERKYYLEGFMKAGYNYGHCDLQIIAY